MKNPKLLLIDSSALVYRAFYALPPLTDKQGRVVNAVYGFISAFLNILNQTRPTHVIFAFDSPKPTHRKEKYEEYKAHREKAPDDLYAQIPISKELINNLGFTELEVAGFEADDIIATCAKEFLKTHSEGEVVVVTGDLDTLQLIDPQTKVFALSRGVTEAKLYDEKAVRERFGLNPKQMNDFKALFGDPSDNIKGVKGIGKKTAAELLQKYQTLEGIYENLDKLKPRMLELLTQEKEQAFLSRELVILEKNIPLDYDLEKTAFSLNDLAAKKEYFEELSFNSLAKRVEKLTNDKPLTTNSGVLNDSSIGSSQRLEPTMVFSPSNEGESPKGEGVVPGIKQLTNVSDLEKQLLPPLNKHYQLILWSGKTEDGKSLAIALLEKNQISEIFLLPVEIAQKLDKSTFKEKGVFLFDLKEICKDIFPLNLPKKLLADLKLKAYLIQPPLMRKFGFKEVVWHFLKERYEEPKKQLTLLAGPEPEKDGLSREKVSEIMDILSRLVPEVEETFAEQVRFQAESQFVPLVFPAVKNKIEERSIDYIYRKIERPLSQVLARMEMAGVKIDVAMLNRLGVVNSRDIDSLKDRIFRLAGKEFNLDSPSQLADVLFRDLNISTEGVKKGRAGHYSTAAGVLEKLEKKHPIISLLLKYREQRKFQTTYLEVIPGLVDKKTFRLHTSFDQTGAATGRLSSNNPNLQNIPLHTISDGLGVRHAFVAEKGFSLVSLDYSQIEIRLAAYLSGEEKLIKAFEKGRDIHRETAAFVNNIDPDKVDDAMRNAAKALNFGIIYGISPFGFAAASSLSETEAKIFIDNYFREFLKIAGYINSIKEFAREFGFVETIFGRRRYVPEVNLDNRILRQAGERMAINMPLQGTAADIMKLALVKVQEYIDTNYPCRDALQCVSTTSDARILLSIHDEIILEVRNNLVEKVVREVREIMENIAKNIIPLKVDVKIGENWGEI